MTGRRFYSRERVAYVDRGKIVVAPITPDDACMTQVERGAQRSYCGNSVLYFEYTDIDTIKNFRRAGAYRPGRRRPLAIPAHAAPLARRRLLRAVRHDGAQESERFLIDAKVSMAENNGSSYCCRAARSYGSSAAASTTATA